MRFKDKTPFSIENDIIDDDVNAESMEDQMKDDSVPSEDFVKLSSWSKEVLGDLVKDVSKDAFRYQKCPENAPS